MGWRTSWFRARRKRRLSRETGPRAEWRPGPDLDGEAAAAAAGGFRVRIADHELRAVQALGVVDDGAHQVLQAERVDQQGDVVGGDGQVVLALLLVELEAVLEPGAAAALDVHAQLERGIAFLG